MRVLLLLLIIIALLSDWGGNGDKTIQLAQSLGIKQFFEVPISLDDLNVENYISMYEDLLKQIDEMNFEDPLNQSLALFLNLGGNQDKPLSKDETSHFISEILTHSDTVLTFVKDEYGIELSEDELNTYISALPKDINLPELIVMAESYGVSVDSILKRLNPYSFKNDLAGNRIDTMLKNQPYGM